MLQSEGQWSYRDNDGVIIPSNIINNEDEVLLREIVKWELVVGYEEVG